MRGNRQIGRFVRKSKYCLGKKKKNHPVYGGGEGRSVILAVGGRAGGVNVVAAYTRPAPTAEQIGRLR